MELKWSTCIRAGATVVLVYLSIHYWDFCTKLLGTAIGAAFPLFLGCIMAYVVNILMSFFEGHFFKKNKNPGIEKIRRPLCMTLSYVAIAFFAVFIVRMIVPELVNCVRILIEQLPKAMESSLIWLEDNFEISGLFAGENNLLKGDSLDIKESLLKAFNFLFTGVGGAMGAAFGIVTSMFSKAVTILISFIFSIYILAGKEKLGGQIRILFKTYLPKRFVEKLFYVLRVMNDSFHNYIVGQCTEAVILGALCAGGMLILQLPYAAMIGCLVGFVALIPVAGAYIGAIVGAFMIFTISPVQAVIFIVYLAVLQQLEGNLIYPRVVGSSVGLPGIWVLAAVTVGGGVLGISGMLIGVPIAATVYRLVQRDVRTRKKA